MNETRFVDLFSGIGGVRLGLSKVSTIAQQRNGVETGQSESLPEGGWGREFPQFRCVWSNDFNKYANQVYTKHFGEEGHYSGDIRGVNPTDIPDFDLLCAGFPCQSFSVAGKRKGFNETRGTLFFEILRIAKAKRPSLLLLENVKGLLNHDRGRTFTVIIQSLDELGYWVEWQVLNSKYFGVPQNRERVFIVGHLRGTGGREIFPITEGNRLPGQSKEQKTVGTLTGGGHSGGHHSDMTLIKEGNIANTVDTDGYLRRGVRDRDEKGKAILTSMTKRRIRRLTPLECERLQGFPDSWTSHGLCKAGDIVWTGKYRKRIEYDEDGEETIRYHPIMTKAKVDGIYLITNTNRYKCLGNAVTVNVIEFLGLKLSSSIKKD